MEAIALKSGTADRARPLSVARPQAMTALMRGDVQMVCLPAISVTPQVAAGKVKILAVSTAQALAAAARRPDAEGEPASTSRPTPGWA